MSDDAARDESWTGRWRAAVAQRKAALAAGQVDLSSGDPYDVWGDPPDLPYRDPHGPFAVLDSALLGAAGSLMDGMTTAARHADRISRGMDAVLDASGLLDFRPAPRSRAAGRSDRTIRS